MCYCVNHFLFLSHIFSKINRYYFNKLPNKKHEIEKIQKGKIRNLKKRKRKTLEKNTEKRITQKKKVPKSIVLRKEKK